MDAWTPSLLAVAIVSLVSLVGALTLTLPGIRSHRALLLLVAVAAGTLMGDVFFHLLPEAVEARGGQGMEQVGMLVLSGFVAFFVLEVALRARHAHAEYAGDDHSHGLGSAQGHHAHASHTHGAQANPGHASGGAAAAAPIAPFAWTNLVGDALHNLIDGAVIAAAFLVDTGVGIATTIAVVVHEVPQELGDFAVLLRAGLGVRKALLFNLLSALTAIVGAVLVLALPIDAATVERFGVPLIAGAFVYIAAADLVPELHHHSKGRDAITILAGFLTGLAIMYGLLRLEQVGILAVSARL